jgi:hypothetical protein
VFEGVGGAADVRYKGDTPTACGDKAVMKATAAAVKYALTTGFLIATGDDPEADGDAGGQAAGKGW